MVYHDKWAECKQCGSKFVFTVELQRHIKGSEQDEELLLICRKCSPRDEKRVPRQPMQLDPVTGHWVGNIKWFDLAKGFGFIARGDGSDIFFHKSETSGSIASYVEGQMVTYDVEETIKGPQAVEVHIYQD